MGAIFTDSRRISETQRFNIVRVRSPRILASFNTIGDGDLWLFWCPWWHFIKNRLIMIIYIKRLWNLLEKEEIEHCYFISNCLVSGISDYRLAIYYTAMYAYTLAKQMAAIQRRCKKIESRLSLNQPLVVDGTGTLLDIYVYQSYQLENIEIKEFRDGLTLMEHMVLKYLLQERDIENSIGYGYRMRKIIEHAKISLRQKAVEYYGWSYIRSMFA